MNSRRRKISMDDRQTGIGGQILGLSLFVMLLAFFIVLNSISSYETAKTDPIMQSVSQAFSTKISQTGQDKPSITESTQRGSGEGDTMEQIESLFRGQIHSVDIVTNRQRGVIVIDVSRDDFEKAVADLGDEKQSTKFGRDFLQTLASVLRSERRRTPYHIEITYHLNDNPARLYNTDPKTVAESIKAVGAMAQAIEDAGMPAALMSIGLQKGDPARVELFFEPHIPFDPETDRAGEE